MLRIGLTGGVASGKSTVAAMLAELGACVIDTDEIAHELVAPGGPALPAVVEAFGQQMIGADGGLDRRRMRRVVFSDAGQRQRLETILHPLIRAMALERAAECAGPYVVMVVPLLFESGFDALVDRAAVVDCPESLQVERLMRRDGISRVEADRILAAQMARSERRSRADDLIDSSVPLDAMQARVVELHDGYLGLARNCPEPAGRAE